MKLTIGQVKTFYENHPNNTTNNFKKNHQGPVLRILDRCLEGSGNGDVVACMKKPDEVAKKIMDKYDNPNTQKFYFQALLFLIDEYPQLKAQLNRERYFNFWQGSKIVKQEHDEGKPKIDGIDYNEIKEKVYKKFGEDSSEALFIDFYEEVPLRLDYHDIRVDMPDEAKNLNTETGVLTLKKYNKTKEKYGDKTITLSTELLNKIKKQLGDKTYVFYFSKTTQGQKIGKILKEAGIENATMNTLRHSVHTKEMSTEERVEMARRSGHAPATSLAYRRPVPVPSPDLTDEEIGELIRDYQIRKRNKS